MKRVTAIIAALIVLQASNAETAFIYCNQESWVNGRTNPSTKAMIAARYENGDSVETDGRTAVDRQGIRWTHIINASGETDEQWVCSDYLTDSRMEEVALHGVIASNGRVAARVKPSKESRRRHWLTPGTEIEITQKSDSWVLTNYGYISIDYVKIYS